MVDRALGRIDRELGLMYSRTGRPSISPERLLRAQLLMILYSVRSERQLMEQMRYNLLFRWFVGLQMDDVVWDVTVFTKNRERLIEGEVSRRLLLAVLEEAREHELLSEEHFSVDGTLIQAWASSRSFEAKKDPPGPGQGTGSGGKVLKRDQVESKTDPEARLYRKSKSERSVPSYLGHVLMENRNGLAVAAQASLSSATAEREVALAMLDATVMQSELAKRELARQEEVKSEEGKEALSKMTLGADTGYQAKEFVEALRVRKLAPHVSEYVEGNLGKNHLTAAERSDERGTISRAKRKLIERVFGWSKLDRQLEQVKYRGLKRVDWFYRLTVTAYNLTRMRRLIPIQSTAC
jgi:transposase